MKGIRYRTIIHYFALAIDLFLGPPTTTTITIIMGPFRFSSVRGPQRSAAPPPRAKTSSAHQSPRHFPNPEFRPMP